MKICFFVQDASKDITEAVSEARDTLSNPTGEESPTRAPIPHRVAFLPGEAMLVDVSVVPKSKAATAVKTKVRAGQSTSARAFLHFFDANEARVKGKEIMS